MGNRRLYEIARIHLLGTPEPEGLMVTALNLFRPIASLPLQNVSFFIVAQPLNGGGAACLQVGKWCGWTGGGISCKIFRI
jgi:hypothetical protein